MDHAYTLVLNGRFQKMLIDSRICLSQPLVHYTLINSYSNNILQRKDRIGQLKKKFHFPLAVDDYLLSRPNKIRHLITPTTLLHDL